MLYTVMIPAKFATDVALGTVGLMTTAGGATTTLVTASTGAIVGTATLVEAGSVAGGAGGAGAAAGSGGTAAATASSLALGPILVGLGAVVLVGVGLYLWHRKRSQRAADDLFAMTVECEENELPDVLEQVRSILDAQAALLEAELAADKA